MITYTTKLIFKNKEDFSKILKVLECQKFCVNECSKVHYGAKKNSVKELHEKFYGQFREKNPEIPAQVVVRSINEVLSNYRSIKSNKHKITKPVKKKNLSIRLDKRLYSYNGKSLKLSSLDGRVTCDFYRYSKLESLLNEFRFKDPLLFVKNGEIWIALTFDTIPAPSREISVCGIDVGMKNFVATSEGVVIQDRHYNAKKRNLRYLKRKLKSKGTKSARKHLRRLKRTEANRSKKQVEKIVNHVVKTSSADVFAVEDLKLIKKNTFKKGNKKFNNRWGSTPIGLFIQILEHKALLNKKKTVKVDPQFTSQRDSRTGKKDGIRQKGRYVGKDGKHLHSDINASINIAKLTKLPLSGNESKRNIALFGQAVVNQPIVCQSCFAYALQALML